MLPRTLAQAVVDEVAGLFDHNVNIMNTDAIIIASGDRQRVGEHHEGAAKVLRTGQEQCISLADVGKFKGAKPGVNAPLILGDSVVGVVGISGDPALVQPVARILGLTVSLLLRQRMLVEHDDFRLHVLAEMMGDLFSGDGRSEAWSHRAESLELSLSPPFVLAGLGFGSRPVHFGRRELFPLQHLAKEVAVWTDPAAALWVVASESNSGPVIRAFERIRASSGGGHFILWCGKAEAYEDLRQLAVLARKVSRYYLTHDCTLRDLEVETALSSVSDEVASGIIARTLGALSVEQVQTLGEFLAADLNVAQVADALCVHPNTVRYRLERICVQSSIDPRTFRGAARFLLALTLQRRL